MGKVLFKFKAMSIIRTKIRSQALSFLRLAMALLLNKLKSVQNGLADFNYFCYKKLIDSWTISLT